MKPVAMLAHNPLLPLLKSSPSKMKLDKGDPLMIGDPDLAELISREPITSSY